MGIKLVLHFDEDYTTDEDVEDLLKREVEKLDYIKEVSNIENVFDERTPFKVYFEVTGELDFNSKQISSKMGGDLDFAHHVQRLDW